MPWVKPKRRDVKTAYVYRGAYGFRYSLRNKEGQVIYESQYPFRSRYDAREAIKKGYPKAEISMEA